MQILPLILCLLINITPANSFNCDGKPLKATIRNNLNGDFALVKDLEEIDQGAFVTLEWEDINLMLPVSFQSDEISFTDTKWLWSYKDNLLGLHHESPRLAQRLPNGTIKDYKCNLYSEDDTT